MAKEKAESEEKTAKRGSPRSFRLGADEWKIIKRIVDKYSPPGFPLSDNAAVKIALAFWAENNPEE
jgi:hypothetical protein